MKRATLSARLGFFSFTCAVLIILGVLLLSHVTRAAGELAIDKIITKNQTTASSSVTTAAFNTTQANELLVAFIAADGPNTVNGQTVTGVTGGNLTWTLRQRVNTQFGTSEIWQAKAPAILTNATVRATLSSSKVSSLTVAAFVGADTAVNGAVGAANAVTGAPSVNVTATRNGSWIWGVGNDYDRAVTRTVGANQTKVSEYLASVGDTIWVQRQTTAGGAAGTVATLHDTAPTNDRWNFAAIEILPAVVDTTAPSVPSGLAATVTGPSAVNLNWAASTDNVGVTGYKVYRGGTQLATATGTNYTDNTTVASTAYSYTVRAVDAAGNVSADSNIATVTTPTPDTTAPTITGINAESITQTGATIVWTTNEASDSLVEYGLTTAYGSTTAFNASLVTSHSAGLSGLSAATAYHYRVKSKDASGNLATSGDNVFTTQVLAPDTTPPTTSVTSPSNGGTVSGTVSVTANATDNVGVAGVQFKLDGNNLGAEDTVSPYSTAWNTVTATNGSHQLTSVAHDAAGNTTTSTVVTVTVSNGGGGGSSLTINGAQRFQTMDGFGVSANSASWDNGELIPALDSLLNNGSTIWRVVIDKADWEAINDNSDPNTFNWTYYNTVYSSPKFQEFWNTVGYLNTKGITNSLYLATMGRGPEFIDHSNGGVNSTADEDEWAEMLASMIYYARNTAHVQFGSVSPGNESDLGGVEGIRLTESQLASMYNKLAVKLDAIGMGDVRIIAPEAAFIDGCLPDYITALFPYPVLMSKIDHIAVHNYNGTTGCTESTIKNSAYPNKNFWVTEYSEFNDAMAMLDEGPSALLMWDGYDSVYNHAIDAGRGTTAPNDGGDDPAMLAYNSTTHTYSPRKQFYEESQLYKYVPAGSVRIGATEANANVTTYAFHDPVSNRVTIVGQNLGSSDVTFSGTLSNVPTFSKFEYYVTDDFVNMQRGSDVSVTGGAFSVVAPGNGIFTLTYSPPADQIPPTAPSDLQAAGSIGMANLNWSPATDNIGVTGYNVYRSTSPSFTPSAANKIGQTTGLSYADVTAPAGTYYYQVTAVDAIGNISPGSNEAQAVVTADIDAPTAPTGLQTSAVGGQSVGLTWTAATDNVGVASYKIYRNGTAIGTSATASFTDTTAQPSTSYSYYVTALDAASNESPASNTITVTTTAVTLSVDTQVFTHQSSTGTTIASPALTTTTSNTLLVAFLTSDGPSAGSSQTFSSVTTSGLTWTLRKRVNAQAGTSEIWTATASSVLTNATVTATRGNGSYVGSMVITAFKGANTAVIGATGGGSAATGAPSSSLVTTSAGSWIWGVGDNWDSATTVTVGAGQTKVDEFQASVGDTFWLQRLNNLSSAAGQTVTINDTAPTNNRWNLALIEILPQ